MKNVEAEKNLFIKTLGDFFRVEREKKSISQQALATKAGLSIRSLTRLEKGAGGFTMGTMLAIASALEIEIKMQVGKSGKVSFKIPS